MARTLAIPISGLAAALLLAGCGKPRQEPMAPEPIDPAVAEALADPIMTDPDLLSQNPIDAALIASGPPSAALPPLDRSAAAVAAAREAAARLTSGGPQAVPEPAPENLQPLRDAVTAAQMASASGIARGDCVTRVSYTARWAAVLPEALQPYPHGAVAEAAGTDQAGCRLRVVHVQTPVPVEDVLAFHHARLKAAGFDLRHGVDGEDHVLRARRGHEAFVLYVRKTADGLTAADLIAGGIPSLRQASRRPTPIIARGCSISAEVTG